mmetsp:Transcript_52249/g.144672  ORF Transcript_52249/g.144672 Transcript_52249/m.144672 type:complete len:208 (+) Transcript_52249:929-1552(+)
MTVSWSIAERSRSAPRASCPTRSRLATSQTGTWPAASGWWPIAALAAARPSGAPMSYRTRAQAPPWSTGCGTSSGALRVGRTSAGRSLTRSPACQRRRCIAGCRSWHPSSPWRGAATRLRVLWSPMMAGGWARRPPKRWARRRAFATRGSGSSRGRCACAIGRPCSAWRLRTSSTRSWPETSPATSWSTAARRRSERSRPSRARASP